MTTYKGINGFAVQSVATDPSPLDEGQVWYNNATYAFKLASATTVGTWAAGGNMGTARYLVGSAGTQTAALAFGGSTYSAATEEYNGTSWAGGGSLNTGREAPGGAGTQTAGLAFGGFKQVPPSPSYSTLTELYNGTSWSSNPTGMNTARALMMQAGTQTAALAAGGDVETPTRVTGATESWNGSTWTTLPATLNTGRRSTTGCGTQTAALGFGGFRDPANSPPVGILSATESWNGSSWTTVNSLNTARSFLAGAGIQTSAVAFGGGTPSVTGATELWDGTSWTSNPNSMTTARNRLGGAGTQASALAFGGGPPATAATEEFTGPGTPVTQTITTS